MPDPRTYHFELPPAGRPTRVDLPEEWYPEIHRYYGDCTSTRMYHPLDGVRAIVIHATAGSSSWGAISVMKEARASFHWLVPDENEPQHGHFVWACAPERLAAWHVRNSATHPDVFEGRNRINHYSLGVELVNNQTHLDRFSDWQVEITARIVRYCWSKYPNLRHVVSHSMLDPMRRSDPGEHFPWARFRDAVMEGEDDRTPELVALARPATAELSQEMAVGENACTP